MKTGRRLLAMLLVLTMLLSNLPLGAIAAEVEDLPAEPTEALTETEQPATEAPAEETEAPETTAAPGETEPVVETTGEAAEEATEEAIVVETQAASEEALMETIGEVDYSPYLIFRWLSSEYDENGTAKYYETEGGIDVTNIDMLPTEPFYVVFYLVTWDETAEAWQYTRVLAEDLEYNHNNMTIEALSGEQVMDPADQGYLAVVTPEITAWDTEDEVAYTMEDETYVAMRCWLGRSPGELYYSDTFNNDTVITRYVIDPAVENVFYYYFDSDQGWTQNSFRMTAGSEYVTWEQLDCGNDYLMKYTFTEEAVAEAVANGYLHLEFESEVWNEEEGSQTWTTPMWVNVKQTVVEADPYLTASPVSNYGDGWFVESEANLTEFHNPLGGIRQMVFWLNNADGTRTPVEVSAKDDVIGLKKVDEAIDGADFYYEVTTNTPNSAGYAVYTHETAGELTLRIGTQPNHFHFTTEASADSANSGLIYDMDLSDLAEADSAEVYAVMFHEDYTWSDVRLSELSENFADIEAVEEGRIYKITIHGNAKDFLFEGTNFVNLEVLSTQTLIESGEVNENGYLYMPLYMTPDPYLTYGNLEGSEEGLFEGEYHGNTAFSIAPGDAYCLIFYVHTWDAEQGCFVERAVPANELYCDDDTFTIAAMPEEDYRPGEANADCFVWVTASEWDHESEIYTYVDDVRSEGLYAATYLPHLGFYNSETPSYDSYIRELVVDPEGENVFYVAITSDYWVIDGEPWVADGNDALLTVETVSDTVIKATLTQEGLDFVLTGEEFWPGIQFVQRNTVDNSTNELCAGGMCVYANSEDVTPDGEGFFLRYLEYQDDVGFYDPHNGDNVGSNIAKYDQYALYFYMKLWDAEQGKYVEIPVHPEHDDGIIMEPIGSGDIREGEELGEYFYHVSIADNALDMDQNVWTEYEGETYSMVITSYLHGIAFYTTQEPSHDTRLMGPVDTDPFGENVVYLVTDGYWEIEDVRVRDWATAFVDVKALSNTAYSVTLTKDGINENMMQWILDIGMDVDTRSLEDSNWTESWNMSVAFSRENLEILGHFGIDDSSWFVIEGGYYREWFTGEYGSDDQGGSWEIWEAEALTDLPDGLTYDYDTNTLTMENFAGERLTFFGEGIPTDTLTIELIGDNSLISEKPNPFSAELMNVVVQGDGSLTVEAINKDYHDENGDAQTFESWYMRGGDLTVQGNAHVTIEVAGQGNESCWDENGKIGEQTGTLRAMFLGDHALYLKDNAHLETVLPGLGRNGDTDVGEGNAIWDERFPGGYWGIYGVSQWNISGGTLVTQLIDVDSYYDEEGNFHANRYVQTGGDVTIQAQYWTSYTDEGQLHAHYEGLAVRPGSTADITGGTLTIDVEASDAHLASSTWYEGIGVRGGELTIGGDAEITVTANHESGNLVGVYCEYGEQGNLNVGKLNITGGTLNVNGTKGVGNGRMGIYCDFDTVFTMTDGTVNSEYADFMNHGPAHITGGTVNIGGEYLYEDTLDDNGKPWFWKTGFFAGGPEFVIDGGTINVTDGSFVADGMVAINGGEINIIDSDMEVNAGCALNDGTINIIHDGNELTADSYYEHPVLIVNNYFSVGGGEGSPELNIEFYLNESAVVVNGTYHQMAGSTVNITHTSAEFPAVWVRTQFDEAGNPLVATDENGEPILDENGEEILLAGSFLMNDGVLNIMNPGDYEAELIKAMWADRHSFTQFRGGVTTVDTAQLFWEGEAQITESAVVEVKDALIITNAGHFVMDDGLLKANEESALWLGMSEMNGGKMELQNAMIEVNGGFSFNNGEIVIDNTAENIDGEAIYASLVVNTYFAIGNPEDPNSSPKLTIRQDLERKNAVQLNGTMHLMTGAAQIDVPVTRAPAMYISGIILDGEGNPLRVDENGNAMGGDFLQNGGTLNINAAENDNIAGIIAAADSVFFMNGGEANFNGTNMVMSGKMFLYDQAVLNVHDGILRLYDTASMEVDGGQLNMDSRIKYGDDVEAVLQSEAGSHVQLTNGAINVTSGEGSYDLGAKLMGTFNQTGGALNIEAPQIGLAVQDNTNITGGTMNILVHGMMIGDEYSEYLAARGLVAEAGENPAAKLTISGGEQFITVPDGGQHNAICYALNAGIPVEITGGVQHLEGQYVYFGVSETGEPNLRLAADKVLYSLEDGTRPQLLTYPFEDVYFEMFEDDNIPGDWDTGEGFDFVSKAVIVSNKAGANTTWEVNDGVLSFQGEGPMADYAAKIPAPWHMVRDFITAAELNSNLTYIGSYAFSTLSALTKLTFLGAAPAFAGDAFVGVTADAHYPAEAGWTADKLQNYGGTINWIADYQPLEISADKDVLFAGEKATLTAQQAPGQEANVVWTLAAGDEDFVTLTVKNNVAAVTAKQVTEKHLVTVYANIENSTAQPGSAVLNVYPKAQAVSIFRDDEEVTGEKIKADVDKVLVLTASLNPSDAEEYLEAPITWTSSNTGIAQVSGNGIVTFQKTGSVKITATAGDGSNKKAVVTVTVLDMAGAITLAQDAPAAIVGGKSATFVAYNAENGAKLKASQVEWSLAEEFAPYAAITTAGKLTTKVVQEPVRITIVATSLDDPTVYVPHDIVICPAATLIEIEKDGMNVTGDTIPVSIEGYTAENPAVVILSAAAFPDGALTNVTWKTSSKGIATVENGVVVSTGKAGTVTITATDANSKKSASVKLAFGIFAETVTVTSAVNTLVSGEKLTLTAETYPANPTKAGVTWSLEDPADKAYLTVTAAGKVTAKTVYAPTEVTLVATSKDGYAEAAYTLTVLPKDENILVIKSGEQYVTKTTQTLDLNAQGGAAITLSAHNLATGTQEAVTWTPATSKLGTLTVNENGSLTVTMTKAGSMTVTAKNSEGKSAAVTLKAVQLATGVTIAEKTTGASQGLTLAAGKTMNLVATVAGVKKAAVTWSVEPAGLATISSSGKLTASKNIAEQKTVTVTARVKDDSELETSVTVTLNPLVQGIRILSESGVIHPSAELTNCTVVHDMKAEQTIRLTAETYPADAASGVTWKSSNKGVAAINAQTGEITCVKPGTVTITASATDGSGKKATFKLTVVKKVTTLTLNYTNAVLAGGKSLALKADVGDATNKNVTWSMTGDTAYVTLSAKGVLKASAVTAPKTVYVIATANDGSDVKGYCTVTIYPATTAVQIWHEGALTTAKTTLQVPAGQSITLKGVSVPGNAAQAFTWKSSGAAATVADGVVTGVTAGKTVTITCTAGDGTGKKATVKVTVIPGA